MSILKEILNGFFAPKIPTVMQSGYHIGERVQYNDHSIRPIHYGTVTRTWETRVKVQFDGFELSTWLETDAIRRCGQ